MKLSTRVRYGLRAMLDIGIHSSSEEVLMKDISRRQDVSVKYLEHIIADLKKAGLIKKTRPKHGGYILAKSAEIIMMADIVRALEGDLIHLECVENPAYCKKASSCASRSFWSRMNSAIGEVLETPLSELLQEQSERFFQAGENYNI